MVDIKTQDTLEILDSWSKRLEGHCTQKRSVKRIEYREVISIFVADSEYDSIAGEDDDIGMIDVTARNLSRSGVCFLHSQNLNSDRIIVALCYDKHKCLYLESQIVRRRQVHNGLWEFGAQFIDRTTM